MSQPSDNVTLGDDLTEQKQSIPCFLCHDAVAIRQDKNQKPYFICDGCGIQSFIRRKQGIRLLKKLQDHSFTSLAVVQLTRELALLKKEKQKVSSQKGLFFTDDELVKAEEAINQKSQEITEKIEKIIQGGETS